jgi:arabinogalactan endo-1,4-beta-galactosidase
MAPRVFLHREIIFFRVRADGRLKGMDISFLDEIESEGGIFYENGIPADM